MLYKNLLLAVAAFSTAGALSAQCNELFISEYVEGTGNNKAIEICLLYTSDAADE